MVNFYLKNCLSTHGLLKCGQETSQGNFFFFTTYLYQTLLQEKSENINCCGTYSFKSVENWTNNLINDTNLAKLFIPINIDNIHWVLIVVDIIQRSIHYYDSCHAEKDEQIQRLKNIEHFMDDFETKKRSSEKKFKWSLHLNDGETPQQKNTYDCGEFICLFCYLISKQQPVKFDQSIIPSFQSHMAISIVECETYEINHLRRQDTIKKVPSGYYFEMVSHQSDHNDVFVAKLKHKL